MYVENWILLDLITELCSIELLIKKGYTCVCVCGVCVLVSIYMFVCCSHIYLDLFHANTQFVTSQDVNWWTGVVWSTCDVLSADWLSFWRHPFTAEHPLMSKWCNATFLQISSNEEVNSFILLKTWSFAHQGCTSKNRYIGKYYYNLKYIFNFNIF